jgi:hypothetical protein
MRQVPVEQDVGDLAGSSGAGAGVSLSRGVAHADKCTNGVISGVIFFFTMQACQVHAPTRLPSFEDVSTVQPKQADPTQHHREHLRKRLRCSVANLAATPALKAP